MQTIKQPNWRVLIIVLTFAVLSNSYSSAQPNGVLLQIFNFNTQQFPIVSFTLRAVNQKGEVSAGVTPNHLIVLDNQNVVQDLVITPTDETPRLTVYVIDTGFSVASDNATVKEILRYGLTTMREGVDQVVIFEHRDDAPRRRVFGPDSSTQRLSAWIDGYSRPRIISNRFPLDTLNEAITQVETVNAGAEMAAAVVYIGQLIEIPAVGTFPDQLAQQHQRAERLGLPIFSFKLGNEAGINGERVTSIANAETRAYSVSSGQDARLTLSSFYDMLNRQRLTYSVKYRVPQINAATDNYTLRVELNRTSLEYNYSVNVEPPTIQIMTPGFGENFTRQARRVEGAEVETWTLDTPSFPVQATVQFPDGIVRDVATANLLVNGQIVNTLTNPGTLVGYTFDISHLQERGSYPQTLQVSVVDAFGLTTSSPSLQVGVEVVIPEGVTQIEVAKTPCEINPDSAECRTDTLRTTVPLAALAALIPVVLALLFIIFKLRKQIKSTANKAAQGMKRLVTEVRDSLVRPSDGTYGDFQILQAELNANKTYSMKERDMIFGRDPEISTVLLFPLELPADQGKVVCTIGSKHCTVEYRIAERRFYITSHKKYRTALVHTNGSETVLDPETPEVLHSGDEIILGYLARNGARIRFTASAALAENKPRRVDTQVGEVVSASPLHTDVSENALESLGAVMPRATQLDDKPEITEASATRNANHQKQTALTNRSNKLDKL